MGTSTTLARHDYFPFGEEIGSGVGLRTPSHGYGVADTNRWKYGMLERDSATGLDHTWWRKYENAAGRWTSPDPLGGRLNDPQSFNRYAYVENDPANAIDPTGLERKICGFTADGEPIYCQEDPPIRTETRGRRPSRADRIIESRGADHGLYWGFGSVNPRSLPQEPRVRTDWNSCAEFVSYLVSLATETQVKPSGSARISGEELARFTRFKND